MVQDVHESIEDLYRTMMDLDQQMLKRFGLAIEDRISLIEGSDFGQINKQRLSRLRELLSKASAIEEDIPSPLHQEINGIINQLRRKFRHAK